MRLVTTTAAKITGVGLLLAATAGVLLSPAATAATGSVAGLVFNDLNADGARTAVGSPTTSAEPGVPGVGVKAYDRTGAAVGATLTGPDGTYTLNVAASATGALRVEFVDLPSGLQSSGSGTNNGSSIQFVQLGATNVDYAVLDPGAFVGAGAPTAAFVQQASGDPATPGANAVATIGTLPWFAQGVTPPVTTVATDDVTGSVWGLAYQRSTGTLFSSAFVKRHSGLTNGPGAIYSAPAGAAPSLYIDVTTLGINVGTVGSNAARGLGAFGQPSLDSAVFTLVGKAGIGSLNMSADDTTLWFTNLNDNKLYRLHNVAVGSTPTFDLATDVFDPTSAVTCTNGSAHSFGVTNYRGRVYVGVTCGAETGTAANLHAFVVSMPDGSYTAPRDSSSAAPAAGFRVDLDVALNYPRGAARTLDGVTQDLAGAWGPWSNVWSPQIGTLDGAAKPAAQPQPMLSDIDFDADGSALLAFSDRFGHQSGYFNVDPAGNPGFDGYQAGDLLLACSTSAGLMLENNSACGSRPAGPGANNGQGPGGGEAIDGDSFRVSGTTAGHDLGFSGAVAVLPGTTAWSSTAEDPVNGGPTFAGGLRWLDAATGVYLGGAVTYQNAGSSNFGFGKASGLGDVDSLRSPAPIEIGNRVWLDTNLNGVQDADEAGIGAVTVELVRNGAVVGTATTAADGTYYFGGVRNTNLIPGTSLDTNSSYVVRVPNATGAAQQAPLTGLSLTVANATTGGGNDRVDSDCVAEGTSGSITYTTGGPGANDHSLDCGFTPIVVSNDNLYSIGDRFWIDTNHNGVQDTGEVGLDGVTVDLCNTVTGAVIATTTTATVNGEPGRYSFKGLAPGTYTVCFHLPPGYVWTIPTQGVNTADSDANFTTVTDAITKSGPITITTGQPVAGGDNPLSLTNPTLDAGVWKPAGAVSLTKYVNEDDANTAPGVNAGSAPLTFRFHVVNTGTTTLVDIHVTDNVIAEASITCPKTTLVVGEAMDCTATLPALAPGAFHIDLASVSGQPVDSSGTPFGPRVTDSNPANAFRNAVGGGTVSNLPATGTDIGVLLGAGAAAVIAGMALLVLGYRRRPERLF